MPNGSVNLAFQEEAEKLQRFIVTGSPVTTSGRLHRERDSHRAFPLFMVDSCF